MDSTRDARLWKLPWLRFAALCRQTSSAAHDASPEKNIASNEKITMVEVCTKPKLGKGFHQNTGAISSFQDMFGQQQWSPQVW